VFGSFYLFYENSSIYYSLSCIFCNIVSISAHIVGFITGDMAIYKGLGFAIIKFPY
jgi:membrane associated rhomboid family serine protease